MNKQTNSALIDCTIKVLIIFFFSSQEFYSQSQKMKIFNTLDWPKKVVWYQIFPERFRNGDTTNDPTLSSLKGSWPHDVESPWQIHPWNSDWYELQQYEKNNGKDIWFNIQRRRYGGDLQGIIDKLDYLKQLGIGAIYLNPVFQSPSSHKYDAASYHHIDPHFGPDPEYDKILIQSEIPDDPTTWVWTSADKLFLKLIEEVHRREMKIIIDGVFNHMGLNSFAFIDVLEYQQNSRFKDWFSIKSWESQGKFDYEGWFGVRELPELKEDESGIVDEPKNYIFNITRRWMDPNADGNPEDGIDGWRLDVAFCVQHQFWKDWRMLVKSINPQSFIIAEIIDSPENLIPYLQGDEFDAVMNYNFLFATAEYFIDEKTKISTSEFLEKLEHLRNLFHEDISYYMQNLFGSHDTQRVLSHILNRDKFKIRNWADSFEKSKGSNQNYNTSKPGKYEKDIFKLMSVFQMTYIGAPYIYYGDEVGMWGANDPCSRKPMLWSDFDYAFETFAPDQTKKNIVDQVNIDFEIYNLIKKLIYIRNNYPVLQIGKFQIIFIDDEKDIFAFRRFLDDDEIIVIINRSSNPTDIELNTKHREYFTDLLNNIKYIPSEENKIKVKVAPYWGTILLKDFYKN